MDSNPNLTPNAALITPRLSEPDAAPGENGEPALSLASGSSTLEVGTGAEADDNTGGRL